jgi:hypothetical protein
MKPHDRLASRPSISWGFLGMLVLVWAIEHNLVRNHLGIQNAHGLSWAYAGNHAKRDAPGREILCFGDSLMKYGLLPRALTQETGRSCYNLAVYGGPPPSSYFVFRRAIDAGARPTAVVVDFIHGFLEQGPASKVRSFPWAHLLNFRESVELCWTARDSDLFAWITLARLFPSVRDRYEIRHFLRYRLKGEVDQGIGHSLLLTRNWNRNNGAVAYSNVPYQDPLPFPNGRPAPGNWTCDPTNEIFLDKFLTLAQKHQIRVYWLMPPISPGYQATLDLSGNEALARVFMREKSQRFANLTIIDGQHAGYENSAFLDAVHLHCDGAKALTSGVSEVIRQPRSDLRPEPRWVLLPSYRTSTIKVPLEIIDESSAIIARKFHEKALRRR